MTEILARRDPKRPPMHPGMLLREDIIPALGKSKAEIAHISHICQIACDAFDALPGLLALGDSEKEICRKFAADMLLRGADKVPYTSIGTGKGGYSSIIQGPTDRRLRQGDILLIDTGAKYAGYYCDFDRNIAIGQHAYALQCTARQTRYPSLPYQSTSHVYPI